MKLLFDANLSWRLINLLEDHFPGCAHVDMTKLTMPAKDIDIWNFAKENNYTIVTNDEDFFHLITTKGFPPKIILLRTGNQSTENVAISLINNKQEIISLIDSEDTGIIEII